MAFVIVLITPSHHGFCLSPYRGLPYTFYMWGGRSQEVLTDKSSLLPQQPLLQSGSER